MLWGLSNPGAASHQSQLRVEKQRAVSSKDCSGKHLSSVGSACGGSTCIQSVSWFPQTSEATDLCFGK